MEKTCPSTFILALKCSQILEYLIMSKQSVDPKWSRIILRFGGSALMKGWLKTQDIWFRAASKLSKVDICPISLLAIFLSFLLSFFLLSFLSFFLSSLIVRNIFFLYFMCWSLVTFQAELNFFCFVVKRMKAKKYKY